MNEESLFRISPMVPVHTINTLESIFQSMSALAANFTEKQWKSATLLPGWSVQDNYSHLVGLERMLQGYEATKHQGPQFDYIKNPFGATNENEVDSRRKLAGSEVLNEWNEIIAIRMSTLRNANEAYFAQETMTPTGPGTVADYLDLRVLDCWMHEQDVRLALSLPGHQHGPAADLTIDRLIRSIPIVVGKRAGTPEGNSVVIVLNGPVHRRVVSTVVNGRAQLDIEGSIAATITMDSQTFVQLAGGRLNYDTVKADIVLEGNRELATKVVTQFTMMI